MMAVLSRLWIANDLKREVFVVLTSIEDRLDIDVDFIISPRRGSPTGAEKDVERDAAGDLRDPLRLGVVPLTAEMRSLCWLER